MRKVEYFHEILLVMKRPTVSLGKGGKEKKKNNYQERKKKKEEALKKGETEGACD